MARGLAVYSAAGLIVFLAAALAAGPLAAAPLAAFGLLMAGRLTLGLGESLTLVGMLSWNIALLGPGRSGLVFSLVGASVYGTIAVGGPLGLWGAERFGFAGLALLCVPLPLLARAMIAGGPAAAPPQAAAPKTSFLQIIGAIWRQGAIVGFQGVGFAALGAFIPLHFASLGWGRAGFALSCFGLGFVLVRLSCGHFPDKFGGLQTTRVSLAAAAAGQLTLWLAPSAEIALAGAFITGAGCSLVYPAMGAEAVRKVRPEARGAAVGAFAVFQDLAYGATGPVAGLFAARFGYAAALMFGFIAALIGLSLAVATPASPPGGGRESA